MYSMSVYLPVRGDRALNSFLHSIAAGVNGTMVAVTTHPTIKAFLTRYYGGTARLENEHSG